MADQYCVLDVECVDDGGDLADPIWIGLRQSRGSAIADEVHRNQADGCEKRNEAVVYAGVIGVAVHGHHRRSIAAVVDDGYISDGGADELAVRIGHRPS